MKLPEIITEAWKLFCPRAGMLSGLMTSPETELERDLAWLDKDGDDPEDPFESVLSLDRGDLVIRGGLELPLNIWIGMAVLLQREFGETIGLLRRGGRKLIIFADPDKPLPVRVRPRIHRCPSCPWRAECSLVFQDPPELPFSQGGVRFEP